MEEVQKIGVRFAPLSLEDDNVINLIKLNKNAFILLTVIALKVRHFDNPINGLVKGSCFLGDFSSYSLTEQEYRSAKKTLIKCGIIEVTATPKGTTAKLVSDLIYAYNFIDRNGQLTPKSTDSQHPNQRAGNGQVTDSQRTSNGHVTTNIESNKEESNKEETTSTIVDVGEVQKIEPSPDPAPSSRMKMFVEDVRSGGPMTNATIKYLYQQSNIEPSEIRSEITKFVDYWTEPNHTGKKQRWQLQPTFDVKRRLITWLGKYSQQQGGRAAAGGNNWWEQPRSGTI